MRLMSKILVAPLAAVALMLAIASVAAWGMAQQRQALADLTGATLEARRALDGVRYELATTSAHVFRLFTLIRNLDGKRIESERAGVKKRLADAAAVLQKVETSGSADDARLVTAAVAAIGAFARNADDAIDMSSVDVNTGLASMMSADEKYKVAVEAVQAVAKVVNERADALMARTQRGAGVASLAMWLTLAAAAAIALALSVVLARRIVHALAELSRSASGMAAGDLEVKFHARSADEVGDMARALDGMRSNFARMIVDIRGTSESIRTASGEVAQGNQDLSSRTEQQASSLQQTAASMEQMTGTVRHNADTASQASQLASAASEVAGRGGTVVAQVVSRMGEISAASRKIEEIITVIDGIAFQTNILALNAAVEAARAGEQGRGFAVVAGEVRNLAQRSAQAAREIKGLIADSVAKVESGGKLVDEAGQTMGEIVAQVKRVTDLIGEITSATLEQSSGIGQVNQAVTQLDQMTQQNAALVEQSAAAAQSLKDQADRLAQAVAMFKVSQGQARQVISNAQQTAARAAPAAPQSGVPAAAQPPSTAAPSPAPVKLPPAKPAAKNDDDWEEF
jgi:methyl-accepting chemotaxis protein